MSSIVFDYNTPIVGSVSRVISNALGGAVDFIINYASRARAERQLYALDDRMLADIGMERGDIHSKVWGTYTR